MRVSISLFCAALLSLAGCRSYEAPIAEQGDRQVSTPPLIVTSSTPDSALRLPQNQPLIVDSTGATRRSAVRRPAEVAVSEPVRRTGGARSRPASRPAIHRVREGESLYSIAFQYDLDVRAIALVNGLQSPYTIFVGQELSLEPGTGAQSQTSVVANVGTAARNNSVAQAQAGTVARGGVIRRSIGPAAAAPNWRWPTQTTRVLRGFGSGDARGIDIAVNSGDAVYAAADGEVVYSGRGVQGSGDLIILRHSDRYLSAYAHNSVMLVEEGSRVIAGDKIAEAGTTPAGEALLHFEIREDGKSIDPVGLLPKR